MKSLFFAVCSCLLYAVYAQIPSCDDFKDGLCKLDADNIVGAFSDVSSAIDCQKLCLLNEDCNFFSFFDFWGRCYLVNACDTIDLFHFQGSMSGPREPSLDSCQDITPTYPPTPPTSGPTGSPTTTPPICNVTMGTLCDSHNNVILEVEHLSTPSDCQSICQNHQECNWWSHWVEEGGEHWGRCYLHYSCDILDDHECRECGGIMRPGHRCNCQHGTPWPDLDTCDDGQVHLPCEDDFIEGSLCDKPGNEILHLTNIPTASDCQAICQNHPDCAFFSHTTRHKGECWLHYNCDVLVNDIPECEENQCVSGPQYPDMDDCSVPELNI